MLFDERVTRSSSRRQRGNEATVKRWSNECGGVRWVVLRKCAGNVGALSASTPISAGRSEMSSDTRTLASMVGDSEVTVGVRPSRYPDRILDGRGRGRAGECRRDALPDGRKARRGADGTPQLLMGRRRRDGITVSCADPPLHTRSPKRRPCIAAGSGLRW